MNVCVYTQLLSRVNDACPIQFSYLDWYIDKLHMYIDLLQLAIWTQMFKLLILVSMCK